MKEGKPLPQLVRGGLKDGFVKTQPLRAGGLRRGQEAGRRREGDCNGGRSCVIFKGPLEGQHGQGGHRGRGVAQTDPILEEDGLSRRRRDRFGGVEVDCGVPARMRTGRGRVLTPMRPHDPGSGRQCDSARFRQPDGGRRRQGAMAAPRVAGAVGGRRGDRDHALRRWRCRSRSSASSSSSPGRNPFEVFGLMYKGGLRDVVRLGQHAHPGVAAAAGGAVHGAAGAARDGHHRRRGGDRHRRLVRGGPGDGRHPGLAPAPPVLVDPADVRRRRSPSGGLWIALAGR